MKFIFNKKLFFILYFNNFINDIRIRTFTINYYQKNSWARYSKGDNYKVIKVIIKIKRVRAKIKIIKNCVIKQAFIIKEAFPHF